MSIEQELSSILARLDLPDESREILRERFAETLDLARHGEDGVGLENLCDNLHEFDVRLTEDARDRLARICRQYGVGEGRIRLLDTLTRP